MTLPAFLLWAASERAASAFIRRIDTVVGASRHRFDFSQAFSKTILPAVTYPFRFAWETIQVCLEMLQTED